MMEKALRYADVIVRCSSAHHQLAAQYRTAKIHHRLASLYHNALRNDVCSTLYPLMFFSCIRLFVIHLVLIQLNAVFVLGKILHQSRVVFYIFLCNWLHFYISQIICSIIISVFVFEFILCQAWNLFSFLMHNVLSPDC